MDPFDLRLWNGFKFAGGSVNQPAIIDQITIDSRRIDSPFSLFVALKGDRQDGHHYVLHAATMGARYALVFQDWPCPYPSPELILLRVSNPLRAFQEITQAYRLQLPVKIIGITGSFGKTMVKDLLHTLLSTQQRVVCSPESFNSQIGVPLSLLTIRQEHEIAIIEAAISKEGEMDNLVDLIQPHYTLLTPIGKKHLPTLEDLSTITQELTKLVFATPERGWSLIPSQSIHEPDLKSIRSPFYFWDQEQNHLPHADMIDCPFMTPAIYRMTFPNQNTYMGTIKLGYSYFLNLMNMAVKAAWLMGISAEHIQEVIKEYQPEPMRTEIWKSPLGAMFINDTYCSDPQSVDQALRFFEYATVDNRKIFIFGGMRGQTAHLESDYRRIGKALNKTKIHRLILFGNKCFDPLIDELQQAESKPEIVVCQHYEETLNYLQPYLRPQDLILVKGDKKAAFDSIPEAFNDSPNNNQCVINLAAIRSNIATLRKKVPVNTRMMIMVKALAYGTDDVFMSKFLATCGIDLLGVSYVDEAVALKRAGIQQSIFSINAAIYEAAKVVKWDLQVGVSEKGLIQVLNQEAVKQDKVVKVHLHVNTGMGRFGCRIEEALELALLIQQSPYLKLEGLMTHFPCADDPHEDPFTHFQVQCFDQLITDLKRINIEIPWIHAANSSGTIRFQFSQYNLVRIGLAIYGLYGSEAVRDALDLRLALSLTSRIVGINICKKGETISYGRRYKVEKEIQKIAVLPIGYFDGVHRNYSGKAYVLIRGKKAPMVGTICMDYMMVDITEIPHVSIGDKVLIFGEDDLGQYISPEDLAMSGDSIIHELITCLGPRIQRIFVQEESRQIR
jgi:alanine racemase/UDP-N-acetylmuramoyl-tripeptide--D-alanyl-D-alanine ligase